MKKKSSFRSTLFYLRVLDGFTFCLIGFLRERFAFGGLIGWRGKLQAASPIQIGRGPHNIQVVRPIKVNKDLRELSYITPYAPGIERPELRRYPPGTGTPLTAKAMTPIAPQPAAPGVNIGFDGIDRNASGCNCSPPDTQGDVGPNYYIQNVNSTTFRIWDKAGTVLITSTLNTLWGTGGTNPCTQGEHFGDPFVFWDPIADRWVLTDFAFAFSGGASQPPYYECIAVSQTNNPVSGGWYLYAVQADTTNTDWLNDYPKFGMWPDAWYSSYNMFCANGKSPAANSDAANTFEGVQVNAWNRTQMLAGAAMSTIFFRLSPAAVGDSYSFLPATYRFGAPQR